MDFFLFAIYRSIHIYRVKDIETLNEQLIALFQFFSLYKISLTLDKEQFHSTKECVYVSENRRSNAISESSALVLK